MAGEERVIVRLRSHGRALIVPAAIFIALCFVATFTLGRVEWELWNLTVLTATSVLALLLCVIPLVAWLSRRFTITNRRVIVRSGVGAVRREVTLSRVHEVSVRRRGLQTMFGSGDVILETAGERPVILADVPSSTLVQRAITDLLANIPEERA